MIPHRDAQVIVSPCCVNLLDEVGVGCLLGESPTLDDCIYVLAVGSFAYKELAALLSNSCCRSELGSNALHVDVNRIAFGSSLVCSNVSCDVGNPYLVCSVRVYRA